MRELDRVCVEGARVLAVDDDPVVLEVLAQVLELLGIELDSTSDPMRFWDLLEANPPDLVIFDVDMPHVDGIELRRALRNDADLGAVPVMFLSGKTDGETRPADVHRGSRRLRPQAHRPPRADHAHRQPAGAREPSPAAGRDARPDGTWPRGARPRTCSRASSAWPYGTTVRSAWRSSTSTTSRVNDTRAHAAGDEVLRRLARLLEAAFRGEDVVARWGGEEFVVGMYGMDRADGLRRIEAVLRDFRTADRVTFSAGVATYPYDGFDLETLHRAADAALYTAKGSGRDQVVAA